MAVFSLILNKHGFEFSFLPYIEDMIYKIHSNNDLLKRKIQDTGYLENNFIILYYQMYILFL